MNSCHCDHTENCDVVDQLSDAKVEIEQLKMGRPPFVPHNALYWYEQCVEINKRIDEQTAIHEGLESDLTAANLEIDRVNRIAEEELDEVNGKVEKLRKAIQMQRVYTPNLIRLEKALEDTEEK